MEIKLRRKGEVLTVEGFEIEDIPVEILEIMPEELEGIDLTAYPVIYTTPGRHGPEKAQALHERIPDVFCVYSYDWANGYGQGVILPDNFNRSRVRFYKSAKQVKKEEDVAKKAQMQYLLEQIPRQVPNIIVNINQTTFSVSIRPDQEVYCWRWEKVVISVAEAKEFYDSSQATWSEWNQRILNAFAESGVAEVPKGWVELVFTGNPAEKAVATYKDKKVVFVFENQNGRWTERRNENG